jgi:putative chitinase
MTLSVDQFKKMFPACKNPDAVVTAFNNDAAKYGVTTLDRVRAFLAQTGHESGGFNIMTENLNYSADGLLKVFAKRFNAAEAKAYARQPQKIANRVYGGRMGNGPEASGDGFKFRGRGYIQLTGHDNYQAFATAIGKTLDEVVIYLGTTDGAMESALWFWKKTGLNEVADTKDIVTMTKKINGGVIGIVERQDLYKKATQVIV